MFGKASYSLSLLLVGMLGYSSWIGINSIWQQLPILSTELPESWSLPAYISVTTQLGNVSIFIFLIIRKYCKISQKAQVWAVLLSQLIGCVLVASCWKNTVGGISLPLFFFTLLVALSDSSTNFVYIPFVGSLKPSFTYAYFFGMGFSGLIPSVLSLAQGVGGVECKFDSRGEVVSFVYLPTHFSLEIYFVIICFFIASAIGAFFSLTQTRLQSSLRSDPVSESEARVLPAKSACYGLAAAIGFMRNGLLPSVQTFSSVPHGMTALHLVVTLTAIFDSVASLVSLKSAYSSWKAMILSIVLGLGSSSVILAGAIKSPSPWLLGCKLGVALVVVFWVMSSFFLSMCNVVLTSHVRKYGESNLFFLGVATQVGSLFGSVVILVVIKFNMLTLPDTCVHLPVCNY